MEQSKEPIRLQKFLSDQGIASRRKCEQYIVQGKVSINGNVVDTLGTKIIPGVDKVVFEGKEIGAEKIKKVYILLNKPIGYVTTAKDQFHRDTVLDLVKIKQRIVPVGRLDMYTSGALILTNDGELVHDITHPSHEINKTYTVTIKGIVSEEEKKQLEQGVILEDGYKTKKAKVKILKTDLEKKISRLEITIHEGKNRQVRKMCKAIDKKVLALHRSKIEGISVKNLKLGTWRYLSIEEVQILKNRRNIQKIREGESK